jgi:putative transposase
MRPALHSTPPKSGWTPNEVYEVLSGGSGFLRDRDGSYGAQVCEAANSLGIREILTAPQSLWRNAYVERMIGSIRRECLDHVIVLNETSLRRVLQSYAG